MKIKKSLILGLALALTIGIISFNAQKANTELGQFMASDNIALAKNNGGDLETDCPPIPFFLCSAKGGIYHNRLAKATAPAPF